MTQAASPARFRALPLFRPETTEPYHLLPCRFIRLDERRYVLTNEVGEYAVVGRETLEAFVRRQLDPDAPAYRTLKSRHFLLDTDSSVALDLLALKQRTRLEPLAAFTSLHIFVVSLRCDHSCPYCQVSRRSEDRTAFDMSETDADRALDFVFRSPAQQIKIEFQGGDPTRSRS